ncbi:lytic murein transglycosylase [Pseudoxanthomonas kalamensis DSM 18571]|uniref:transglycosylase SLT domain-containing protein n=1 Tax=Pseudoxanthomonas kalamensis TaxID=289483 RepID=UPI00139085EF|nr:transglycosylase SLT domain-containing protein [Pseudoxanthomonas kalamensis]KAF1712118.1 lytic murein transglycosylase [Pseudoxanthomonas kalamensis DSM 18571]
MKGFDSLILAAVLWLPALPPLHAQDLDAGRPQIENALRAAERGDYRAQDFPAVASHPLNGWVEFADLSRNVNTLSRARGEAFLKRYAGQAVAERFRDHWLAALARRQEWPAFLAAWQPNDDAGLRCAWLNARQATGHLDDAWTADAQAVWTSSGKSLPNACDPVFALLASRGGLGPELRWQRIDLAAEAGQTGVMRHIARDLRSADEALANDYAAFIDAPHARALDWPKTERSRQMAMYGLMRQGRRDPDLAERQLPAYANALDMSAAQRGQVQYQIALWTVASYLPDSARRLDEVPDAAYDERLHEWQVREAMARGDWRNALRALRRMPAAQRDDSRWRYFEARLAEKTGEAAEARRLYALAARASTFHGFLAADTLGLPYALCPWEPDDTAAAKAAIARDPAIVRAMELWKLERSGWAVQEWKSAMARFDDTQRRLAVEVAQDNAWFDRAVFYLGQNPDEYRLYSLRFPLHHDAAIRREAARHALDPAWVAAEIRAESVFNSRARSPADARGLMQVLPSTGAATAKKLGRAWGGAGSLYDADTNIALGTAYLREVLDKYGLPYVAIGAYNAGPTPTARWLSQRPNYDADFWIETVSYKETREYIARVLAFSVIYDWRLNGDALPLSERMQGRIDAPRKAFACPSA